MEGVIQVAGAFLAIYAFSVANDAPKKYLVYCGLTGAFGWAVYLIALPGCGVVFANFLGAGAIALASHILARVFKIPVTVFLIAGILTIVPGADLYRSVYHFCMGSTEPDRGLSGADDSERRDDRIGDFYCGFSVFCLLEPLEGQEMKKKIAIFSKLYYNSVCKKNLPFKNFFYEPLINYLYSPRKTR